MFSIDSDTHRTSITRYESTGQVSMRRLDQWRIHGVQKAGNFVAQA